MTVPFVPPRRRVVSVVLAVIGITFACYARTGSHDFINYDDPAYVTENPAVRAGLTAEGVRWAFAETYYSSWHPVTWLSHMLDVTLFGMDAGMHHLVSAAVHAVSAGLLFLALYRMTGSPGPSAFVAALFGVHPLHVESVAWIAERKDVLSGLFFMLVLLSYERYARRGGGLHYAIVVVLLAAGLMAKPMLVTVPFVLLLLDVWPLGRTKYAPPADGSAWAPLSASRLLMEKVPLLLLALASTAVTFLAQHRGSSVVTTDLIPFSLRIANAVLAYAAYLGKMVWPVRLAVFYPFPESGVPTGPLLLAGALLIVLTVLAFRQRRQRPFVAVGWFWYLGMLVPVIGLVQVGSQAMADRYAYLPLIGAYLMISWSLAGIPAAAGTRSGRARAAGAVIVIAALCSVTVVQAGHWRTSETLFGHALSVTAGNAVAHNNLGHALFARGRTYEAVQHFRAAIHVQPFHADAHYNLGRALSPFPDKLDEAIEHFRTALRINPGDADYHVSLGLALERKGRIDDAFVHARKALELRPGSEAATRLLAVLSRGASEGASGVTR